MCFLGTTTSPLHHLAAQTSVYRFARKTTSGAYEQRCPGRPPFPISCAPRSARRRRRNVICSPECLINRVRNISVGHLCRKLTNHDHARSTIGRHQHRRRAIGITGNAARRAEMVYYLLRADRQVVVQSCRLLSTRKSYTQVAILRTESRFPWYLSLRTDALPINHQPAGTVSHEIRRSIHAVFDLRTNVSHRLGSFQYAPRTLGYRATEL